jgi:hypothetical protein
MGIGDFYGRKIVYRQTVLDISYSFGLVLMKRSPVSLICPHKPPTYT